MLHAATRHSEPWRYTRGGTRHHGGDAPPAGRRRRSRPDVLRVALLRAGAALLLAPVLGAQPTEPAGGDADHQYARAAHRAVERFERQRRFLLPVTRGDAGRCDVRVGSYCYWYDENEGPGPAEPARIARVRQALLAYLDSLSERQPADGWLTGQRVRYRLDDGDTAAALTVAGSCAAERWWCAALSGLALHHADRTAAADSMFAVALAAMPDDLACRWRDVGMLLDDRARRSYQSLPCPDREPVERRFWWLASPLWSEAGNGFRAEHFSRLVLGAIAGEGATPYGGRWTGDMNELVVRYGWPGRWSRRERGSGTMPEMVVVGHDASPSYHWPADTRLLDTPFDAVAGDWTPREPLARSRALVRRARRLHDLDAVVSLLRRGDSLRAVAAIAMPDATPAGAWGNATAALVLASDTSALVTAKVGVAAGASSLVEASAVDGPLLASVEVTGDSGHAARLRTALRPPPLDRGFGISDLLLYLPDDDADTTLQAVRAATVAGSVPAGHRDLGIYWELYGLGEGAAAVRTELVVPGGRPGWIERAWRRVRGTSRGDAVRLRWTDVTTGGVGRPRAVFIRLDALSEGAYTIELTVTAPDGRTSTARRTLRVARPRDPTRSGPSG